MTNQPPYNPYANCWAPCGHYNPNANCASNNIVDQLLMTACDPIYKVTYEPPKYDVRNGGEIYEIVTVQELDE